MTTLYLPPSPSLGQEYVGINGVIYTWMGDRWSSETALTKGTAAFYYEGGDSTTFATPTTPVPYGEINGGDSLGN